MEYTGDFADYGIILALQGPTPALTYVDRKGNTQHYEALTGAGWIDMQATAALNASQPYVARTIGLEARFQMFFSGATSYIVRMVTRRVGSTNWIPIQSARSDSGVIAAEHTVVPADNIPELLLQTASEYLGDQFEVQVKVAGEPGTGDKIICYMRAA